MNTCQHCGEPTDYMTCGACVDDLHDDDAPDASLLMQPLQDETRERTYWREQPEGNLTFHVDPSW